MLLVLWRVAKIKQYKMLFCHLTHNFQWFTRCCSLFWKRQAEVVSRAPCGLTASFRPELRLLGRETEEKLVKMANPSDREWRGTAPQKSWAFCPSWDKTQRCSLRQEVRAARLGLALLTVSSTIQTLKEKFLKLFGVVLFSLFEYLSKKKDKGSLATSPK